MHLELPFKSSLIIYHANKKTNILNKEVDVGPLLNKDYSSYMTVEPDDINSPVFKDLTKAYEDNPPAGSRAGVFSCSSIA